MVMISIMYPNRDCSTFDLEVYINTHMPMSIERLSTHPGFCQGRRTFDPHRRGELTHPRRSPFPTPILRSGRPLPIIPVRFRRRPHAPSCPDRTPKSWRRRLQSPCPPALLRTRLTQQRIGMAIQRAWRPTPACHSPQPEAVALRPTSHRSQASPPTPPPSARASDNSVH